MKNKTFKSLISSLMAGAVIISSMCVGMFAYGDDTVVINSANFPDDNWRTVVKNYYDANGDGYLSSDERVGSVMSVSGMLEDACGENAQISNLKGIEYFTNIKRLRCGGIGLKTLDVTAMPQLIEITCEGNELTALDLSQNTRLEWLNCSSNAFASIDVSANTKLTKLDCYANHLTSLDVSALTSLATLRCQQNELTALDLRSNTALQTLMCANNHLTALNLSANTQLTSVTNTMIGYQTVDARAVVDGDVYLVNLAVADSQNIVSTSLDRIEVADGEDIAVSGYDGNDFVAFNVADIADGVDYVYDVQLAGAESMAVHVNVERDFWQVNFYTAADKQTLITSCIVNTGESAPTPEITDIPQCKAFDSWSEDFTSVTTDMDVYAIWRDDHHYDVTAFDGTTVIVSCPGCNDSSTYSWIDLFTKRSGDASYVPEVDRNSDGVINVKDYALMSKQFRQ